MKSIIGAYLIDAPFSALNNSGTVKNSAYDNEVATKKINSPRGIRPYVSAQAVRYWWRTILENNSKWKCSPVEKVGNKSQAITKANPLEYADDDIFGYMSAKKEETEEKDKKGNKKMEDVTVTRVSPLKCSPLIGLPIKPISDFGTLTRKLEGDAVPFNHEFYSNILKGIFAIDLDSAGRFTKIDKPGSMNLSEDLAKDYEKKGLKKEDKTYELPIEEKKKRITDTLKALKYLNGGAMQALHHTDVTPKIIILAALNNGNNIFMNVMPHDRYDDGLVNTDALLEVLEDYKNDLLSKVYIGKISGFGADKDKEIDSFRGPKGVEVVVTTPVRAIDEFIKEISNSEKIWGK